MQKTVYSCDACAKEIGPKKHISLHLNNNAATGIAVLLGNSLEIGTPRWGVHHIYGFLHFCDGKCIGKYFDAKIKEAK